VKWITSEWPTIGELFINTTPSVVTNQTKRAPLEGQPMESLDPLALGEAAIDPEDHHGALTEAALKTQEGSWKGSTLP